MKIIDERGLLDAVNDIEIYISKKNPSQLEYQLILQMLMDRLNQRKLIKKKEQINKSIPALIKSVKEQMLG